MKAREATCPGPRHLIVALLISLVLAPAAGASQLSFSGAEHVAAGNGPWLLSDGDVLGNGRTDLAVANIFSLGSNGASLLLNNTRAGAATPSFSAPRAFDGYGTQAVLLADFSGDSKPELVVCDEPALPVGRCTVHPNTTVPGASTPTLGAQLVLHTGDTPEVLAAADMTGDGKLDLVVANFGSLGPGAITMFRNTSTPGHLSFAPPQNFTGGIGAEGMVVADLNGDGKPDIVTGNTAGNNFTALVNETPSGSDQIRLSAPQVLPGNTLGPTAVTAGDLNGDGKLDIIGGTSFTFDANDLNVYMNKTPNGSDTLSFTHQVFAADPGIEGITAADFSGNGKPDIAYAAYRTPIGMPTAAICGTGGLLPPLCSDLGGNGFNGGIGAMQNTTPTGSMVASFASPVKLASGFGTVAVITGDFAGHCKPDIAAGNFTATGTAGISIFTNQTPWTHAPACPAQPVAGIGPGLGL